MQIGTLQLTKAKTRKIEVFRPGSFVAMGGEHVTFGAADLMAIAGAYDCVNSPVPVVVGHPKTDDPAFGWATTFSYDEASERLTAEIGEIAPEFETAVSDGRYKKISLSLYGPTAPGNPKPGQWYPKHIGFLGAAAPAVSGLKPVQFSSEDGVQTFEFADASALRDVASLFRKMREFFIEQFGSEKADKALPDWTISWIAEAAEREVPEFPNVNPYFAAPVPPAKIKEPSMAEQNEMARREAAVAKREAELAHAENVAFAESVVADNRLLPVLKDNVVAVLDGLSAISNQTVSFAEADGTKADKPLVEAFKSILKANPTVVPFGETNMGDAPEEISFANAGDVAAKASAYVSEQAAKGITITIADAIDHLDKGASK